MNDRTKQELPADLIARLMAVVRNQFCGDLEGSEWGKNSHFVKRNVILWPAYFICNKNGFTLPAHRYEAIMGVIFEGIKRHGQTGSVRYWQGYLMKCVQDHWNHHWEEYYAEAKASRNIAETALANIGRLSERTDPTVETLAGVHKVLAAKAKQTKKPAIQEQALPGF